MFKYTKLVALMAALVGFIGASALHAAWVEDGIAVCTMGGVQDLPVVVTDGSGGAIIVWRDDRVLNTDIYAQRIDADGSVLWPTTAMPVCTAPNSQSYPRIVSDGDGGAIIAWQDPRGGADPDIYMQRINADGYIQWQAEGVPVCTGQLDAKIGELISDGSGGAIVTWCDKRDGYYYHIFAQKINAMGAVQWMVNGVEAGLVPAPDHRHQERPVLASDGAGGAIIVWEDRRNGAADIYGQRINAAGALQWSTEGIAICNSGYVQQYARIISDGAGGAIVAWDDRRNANNYDIFAQRVDGSGTLLWGPSSVAIAATMYDQEDCRIVSIGSGEAIIAWEDYRGGTYSDIYAQKVDASGVTQWTSNGVIVCAATGNQLKVELVANGLGGAVATWEDYRGGDSDVYAQRIDPDGSSGWSADGLIVCDASATQATPQLAPDEWGGASFTWVDDRSVDNDIYCQKIDAAGDIGTATMLHDFTVAPRGLNMEITWTLSEAEGNFVFFILRSGELSTNFAEIASIDGIENDLSYTFIDGECDPGVIYRYRVDVRDDGERRVLFETGPIEVPAAALILEQNIPNPFNPATTIGYRVPGRCRVVIDVYSVAGVPVTRLVDRDVGAGSYTAVWNGCDENGRPVRSGVYFYRLKAGKTVLSRKMILLR